MKTATATPQAEKLLPALLERSAALQVTDQESYIVAASFLTEAKSFMALCDKEFDEQISQAYNLHKTLVAQKKKYYGPAEEAYKAVNGRRIAFESIERQKQEAERRRLEDIERKRLEDEQKARAAEAKKAGDAKAAKAIMKEEIVVPDIEVPDALPDVEVPRTQIRWDVLVSDPRALLRACAAARPGETAYLACVPDMVYLRKQAVAQKTELRIPGVKAFSKTL